jgi:hypothetical protein
VLPGSGMVPRDGSQPNVCQCILTGGPRHDATSPEIPIIGTQAQRVGFGLSPTVERS